MLGEYLPFAGAEIIWYALRHTATTAIPKAFGTKRNENIVATVHKSLQR
jgi:hypothetical protein